MLLKFRAMINPLIRPADRREIGERIIEEIIHRTRFKYKDKNNVRFPKYTKEYAAKKGVPRTKVDLTDLGDMLDDLSVLRTGAGFIEIGYEKDSAERKKAEGNITGSYGKYPRASKARDFLGLTQKEIDKIVSEVVTESEDIKYAASEARKKRLSDEEAAQAIAESIVDEYGIGEFDFEEY